MSNLQAKKCGQPAFYRFTWPGAQEGFVCFLHAIELLLVAQAMGMYLHLVQLKAGDEQVCEQSLRTGLVGVSEVVQSDQQAADEGGQA